MKKSNPLLVTIVAGFIGGLAAGGVLADLVTFGMEKAAAVTRTFALRRAEHCIADGRAAEALRVYEGLLPQVSPVKDPAPYGAVKNGEGTALFILSEGRDRAKLEQAADAFAEAVKAAPAAERPDARAMALQNRGNALVTLAGAGGAYTALDEAIASYAEALKLSPVGRHPERYASLCAGLGNACAARGRAAGDREEAIRWFDEALKIYTTERYPAQRAAVAEARTKAASNGGRPL